MIRGYPFINPFFLSKRQFTNSISALLFHSPGQSPVSYIIPPVTSWVVSPLTIMGRAYRILGSYFLYYSNIGPNIRAHWQFLLFQQEVHIYAHGPFARLSRRRSSLTESPALLAITRRTSVRDTTPVARFLSSVTQSRWARVAISFATVW